LPRPFVFQTDTVLSDAIHVTSDTPISILCYFSTSNGSEAFIPLPVSSWGTEYVAMTLRNALYQHAGNRGDMEENTYADFAPGEILVVAAEDSTDVTIAATTPTRRFSDTTLRLDAGQMYLIESHDPWAPTDTTTRDLSGTRITSTRPVGVISGNTRSTGGFGGTYLNLPTWNSLNNSLVEFLCPISLGGNTFVYRPHFTRTNERSQELLRLYATEPGLTSVSVSNGFPSKSITQGEFVEYSYCADPTVGAPFGAFSRTFALRTDKPAQAMIVTASVSEPAGLL